MTQLLDSDDTTALVADDELAGHELTRLAPAFLAIAALLALVAGLDVYAGSEHTKDFFAWGLSSPVSATLVGAGLIGVVPMLFAASHRVLWEEARIAVVPAGVLVLGMAGVSVLHREDLTLGGGTIIALALAWGWLLAMIGLTIFAGVVLLAQLSEPGLPLARTSPLPRLVLPAIAVEASALFGLGLGLLGNPGFWGGLLPWQVSVLDARALGVWGLTLGWALLQALAEDDLHRVQPGLVGILGIGVLGLAGLAWHRAEIDWATWGAASCVALLAGLVATGVIGLTLLRLSRTSGEGSSRA